MRNPAILLTAAALAGCAERQAGTAADAGAAVRAAAAAAAAADPRIMTACPEATNYAPPDWPLEPGDVVGDLEFSRLLREHYDDLGTAVVWVAGDSGLEGAIPFGAGFLPVDETGTRRDGRGSHEMYLGHLPAVRGATDWDFANENILPDALRGLLDGAPVPGYESNVVWRRVKDRINAVRGSAAVVLGDFVVLVRPRNLAAAVAGQPRWKAESIAENGVTPGGPLWRRAGFEGDAIEEAVAARALWYGEGASW